MPKPMCSSNVCVATKLFCIESVRCVSYNLRVTLFLQNLMKVIKLTCAPSSIPYSPPPPNTHTHTKGAVTYLFCVVTMFFFCDTDVLIHCKQTNIIHQLPSIHFSCMSTVMHQNEQNAIMFLQVRETDRQTVFVGLSVCAACMHEIVWSLCVCMKERQWERERDRDRDTHSERETWFTVLLTFSIREVNAWSPH